MSELLQVKKGSKITRPVLTESEALTILRNNRIVIEYPKIVLPKVGPGLKCWTAIDCLTNRVKPRYFVTGRGGKA